MRPLKRALLPMGVLAIAIAGPARASQSDTQDEEEKVIAAEAAGAEAPRAPGKPVAFDPGWLDPFFKTGVAKQGVDKFREESWSDAETAFARAVRKLPKGAPERLAATYMLALARENQGNWSDAGPLFEDLYARYPKLAVYHAYHAARCRLRRGDAAGALEWAAKVPRKSVPEAETALVRIDALRALGRWDEALSALEVYIERFPNGPRRAEALFRKAEAMEKIAASRTPPESDAVLADVTAIYRRVWAEAPVEAWSERADARIAELAKTLPPDQAKLVRTHVASEWVARGMRLFEENRNVDSETAFAAALGAPGLDSDLECRARYHRAQSVWKQRQRPRAAPLFDEAEGSCFRAGNRDLHAKSLYQAARCYAATGARAEATARFARVETEHGDHSYADDARVRQAELATDAGEAEEAARLLGEVPTRYPNGDLLNEALWRLAFASWRAGRTEEALHWLDENLRLVPHEEIWYAEGRVQYWKGRVFERQGKPEDAVTWYERAVREYPLSVYALLGLRRMQSLDSHAQSKLVAELRARMRKVPAWTFPARPLFGDAGFLRAVELARMGQGGDARRELAKLGLETSADKHKAVKTGPNDDDLLWITAILLDRGGVWSASHSIPRYGVTGYRLQYPEGIGVARWKLSYPRAFPELVKKNARANGIPEALQLAIMREESAFSPRTESFANAIGLTQMLVKTAKRFSNGAPVTRDVLLDPTKNVEIGSRFLGFLWQHFGSTPPLTIAGYNAGEGAVERWLGERGDLAMDEFMETIPYDETRNYTKRVLASFFAYSWLYSDKPVPSIPLAARGSPHPPVSEASRRGEKPKARSRAQ